MVESNIEKSTTESTVEKIELFQSLIKSSTGKYLAILSDDSIDRDGEIVSKAALQKVCGDNKGKTAILLNHENKIENLIGEWTNKRLEQIGEHTALVAEPKFYLSNPSAKMIKGLLDDGAECGISIGAIVKDRKTEKINGKSVNVYTDLELIEASFVAIPSNRHGMAMAMAKKFEKKLYEETQMEEKIYTEKEYLDLETSKASVDAELEKSQERVTELEKELTEVEPEVAEEPEAEKDISIDVSKEIEDLKVKNTQLEKDIEDLKKSPVLKATFDTPQDGETKKKQETGIPVIRR